MPSRSQIQFFMEEIGQNCFRFARKQQKASARSDAGEAKTIALSCSSFADFLEQARHNLDHLCVHNSIVRDSFLQGD